MTSPVACPDAERLAACAEGLLRGAEREQVFRHVLSCADCSTVLTDTLHALDESPPGLGQVVEGTTAGPLASGVGVDPAAAAAARSLPVPAIADAGRVTRFAPRRWAPVALPLAAGLLFGLWLASSRDAVRPGGGPAVATGASNSPSSPPPRPPERAAVELVDPDRLPAEALPKTAGPGLGFGGARLTGSRLCLFLGTETALLEVRVRLEPRQADAGLRTLAAWMPDSTPAGRQYRELIARLMESGRMPTGEELRPRTGCERAWEVGRAVSWVLVAASSEQLELLQHEEITRGLEQRGTLPDGVSRSDLDYLARLVGACAAGSGRCEWRDLRDRADALRGSWQP
jgi:hypothetical protein